VPDKKRVLIVDDDGNLCQQLGKIIEFFGYQAVLAGSNAEARQQIRSAAPDLVIADLHLPDGTGLDLLHELHAADPHLPVIILTGYPTQETIRRTLLDGGYTYLAKPVALDQLRQILEHALVPRD
jgi:two-component system response regulator PilR (NtrC family)